MSAFPELLRRYWGYLKLSSFIVASAWFIVALKNVGQSKPIFDETAVGYIIALFVLNPALIAMADEFIRLFDDNNPRFKT